MLLTDTIPSNLSREGLYTKNVTHPCLEKVDPHYHERDEWLRVRRGSITFTDVRTRQKYTATDTVPAQRCFHIPAGEVHAVEVGQQGVEYEMWTRGAKGVGFRSLQQPQAHGLAQDRVAELIRINFELPEWENEAGRQHKVPQALRAVLHDRLLFRRANGLVQNLDECLCAWASPGNKPNRLGSSDLEVRFHQDEAVVSITVYTADAGAAPQGFRNIRHFVLEEEQWKLRFWVNFPRSEARQPLLDRVLARAGLCRNSKPR